MATMQKPRLNVGSAALRSQMTPEALTLWALVGLELLAHVGLRQWYRKHHGG